MNKEEILFLNQLIDSLEKSVEQMENFYLERNYANFNQSKKIMLNLQKEIDNLLK